KLGVPRNFNRVGDGSIAEAGHVLADANEAAMLFDGRSADYSLKFFLGAAQERAGVDFAVYVDFAVGAGVHVEGTGGAGGFYADCRGAAQSEVERAMLCRSDTTGSQSECRGKDSR